MDHNILDGLREYFLRELDFAGEEDAGPYGRDCLIAAVGKTILTILGGLPIFSSGYLVSVAFSLVMIVGVLLPFMAATVRRANAVNRSKLWCVTVLFLPGPLGPLLNWLILRKDR